MEVAVGSPFPGIDPFIEGQWWSDFHTDFITALRGELAPKVTPRYIAVIEERVYLERRSEQPTERRPHVRPDVSVAIDAARRLSASPTGALRSVPVQVSLSLPESIREVYIEVRLRDTFEVVTAIELLSPGNKRARSDGRVEYLAKREKLLRSRVHLVELDFLRGGEPLPMAEDLPDSYGWAIVSRSDRRPVADVWPVYLREPLPSIAIPLGGTDPDIDVDLQVAFNTVYERACYAALLEYRRPPDPPLDSGDEEWARQVLALQQSPG